MTGPKPLALCSMSAYNLVQRIRTSHCHERSTPMANSEARRQKQLAKKKAKRQEKRDYLARRNSDDPTIQLANATHWPVVDALVPEDLWHRGMGQVVIARRHPDGR